MITQGGPHCDVCDKYILNVHYKFSYESMVKKTITEMVKREALRP